MTQKLFAAACGLAMAWCSATPTRADDRPISFSADVQPILTKLGCNQGACHGAQYGKGGFKLSLRGFDDRADHQEIVRCFEGRRVQLSDPTFSLLVAKPTLAIPHKGGKRLEVDSWAYNTLIHWIEQGASGSAGNEPKLRHLQVMPPETTLKPGMKVRLQAVANFESNMSEDVTSKASFDTTATSVVDVAADGTVVGRGSGEATVMVRYLGFVGVARFIIPFGPATGLDEFTTYNDIDKHWVRKWRQLGLSPTKTVGDAQFLRRLCLDTIGTLPSREEVLAFVADKSPDKRNRAIDAVLNRPEYVDNWAHKWGDILRNNRNLLGDKGMWSLHNWLRAAFRDNKPADQITRELLTAVGSPYQDGPANYYKVGNNATDWAENTAQVFLGVRIQCARCHHHPFENISQNDFNSMTTFFSQVGTKQSDEFGLFGRDSVIYVRESPVQPRRGGGVMQRTRSTPLGGKLGGGPVDDDPADRRRSLAGWLTAKDNPLLARNLVNRYWGYYFGRGLVHPIDDMRVTNPASCPEALDALAADFIAGGYDIKRLMRTIMQSHVYQLRATANPNSKVDVDNVYCTHYAPKRMSAEQLLDAIDYACGTREKFNQLPLGYRAIGLPDSNVQSKFLDVFGRPKREISCECERSDTPSMTQALQFMTGNLLNRKVSDNNGRIAALLAKKTPIDQIVVEIYLHTVCRPPSSKEAQSAAFLIAKSPTPRAGLEDLLWAMLNTREFQFNH